MNIIQNWNISQRRHFVPSNKSDMKLVKTFLTKSSWGNERCPFILEWPYLDIPTMLKQKITEHTLKGL